MATDSWVMKTHLQHIVVKFFWSKEVSKLSDETMLRYAKKMVI